MPSIRNVIAVIGMCLLAPVLYADEPANEKAIHDELRALRKDLIEAYNDNDIDRLLSNCQENVIVTWQNGEVSVGHQGIRDYYDRMMNGPDRVVASLRVDPTVDDISTIYGDSTAIARGKMNDRYELTSGKNFDLNSRWSATAIKEADRWLIASFHASANVFDNGVLSLMTRQIMFWTGAIALSVGLVGGGILGWSISKRRSTPA